MILPSTNCGKELVNAGSICDLCVCGGETIRSFWKCSSCKSYYYDEYFDCWDSENPENIWFELPEEDFNEGLARIAPCPRPTKKFCDCPLHPFSMDLTHAKRL